MLQNEDLLNGHPLRVLRTQLDLSQKDLAAKVGVSEATILRAENGHRISPKVRHLLCDYLGRTSEELGLMGRKREVIRPASPPPQAAQNVPSQTVSTQLQSLQTPHDVKNTPTVTIHIEPSKPNSFLESQHEHAWLTLGASSLGQLFTSGWSIDEILESQIVSQDIREVPIATRRKLFLLGADAVIHGIPASHEGENRDWAVWFGMQQSQIITLIHVLSKQAFMIDAIQTLVDQEIKMMDDALNQYDLSEQQNISRRQALITIAALPTTLLTWNKQLLTDTLAEEFLPQCAASITACWHLFKGKGLLAVSDILPKYVPLLTTLALHPSKHQQVAARLATQTSILQAIIAMHTLQFAARERHCKDAIRYSRLSGEHTLQATAFMYLGYTLSFCYQPRQPEKAIPLFLAGLDALRNDNSLIRSDILMGLGEAYAQCNDEQHALYYLGLAQTHFPSDPEYDSSYPYAECGLTTLYQWEGKTYLELAEYIPNKGYQQKASDALLRSIEAHTLSERCTNETLIYQADAARLLGELEMYSHTLRQAVSMAIELGSKKRYNEALQVYQKTPQKWLNEPRIQGLTKEIFQQLPRTNT